ncbi:hypothetical protein TL16_g09986 [Triparma laevis f. inornata]|uniref:Glycerophosphocholine acyltransferase 1 n=1 Tax=Triparma laevis f. inornata TaxID=1714386 RepID=A0A9W7BDI6_9STRA|nr:hypothetical protein TL16_g09986 [Triparma laevis f. inornata]
MDPTYVDVSKGSLMRRAPSGVRDATLREALNNIRSKQDHFQAEGLRKTNFTIGVITTFATAFCLGGYPEWYWVFYCMKAVFLVFWKVAFFWYPLKQHYFFFDFCWISNGIFFVLFVALLLNIVSPSVTQNLFLVFFCVANGPLAWSVILLQNKLVFHNFEWSSTLFIHLSPAMASAGIHWNRSKVAETWGERFEATAKTDHSGLDMFYVGLTYYYIWWILFTVWMLTRGLHYPEWGYHTVFDALKKAHNFEEIGIFKGKSLRMQIVVYMLLHAAGCTVGLAWSIGCWYSYYFHAGFIAICWVSAIVQGSSWYLYAIQTASIKQVEDMLVERETEMRLTGASV